MTENNPSKTPHNILGVGEIGFASMACLDLVEPKMANHYRRSVALAHRPVVPEMD